MTNNGEERKRSEWAANVANSRRQHFRRISGVPERFKNFSFSDFVTSGDKGKQCVLDAVKEYDANFDTVLNEGQCMAFYGFPGTGKTMLASCLANSIIDKTYAEYELNKEYNKLSKTYRDEYDLIEHNYFALYRTEYYLLSKIKQTWRYDSKDTDVEVIERVKIPELLIIDEVGLSCNNDSDKNLLYQFINARYDMKRPTLIISNLNEKDLTEYAGVRVMDRLKENGGIKLVFNWESYRR